MGLPVFFSLIGPELKDEGFARAGGGLHDDILPFPQGFHRLLLPEVRHGDLLERGKLVELVPEGLHNPEHSRTRPMWNGILSDDRDQTPEEDFRWRFPRLLP